MKIIKRNGSIAEFDPDKIRIAIAKANNEIDEANKITMDEIARITTAVVKACTGKDSDVTVEEVQDLVIDSLADAKHFPLMRLYGDYRYKRKLIRESREKDETILTLIRGTNEELNKENSNKSTSLNSTQRDYMAGEVSKDLSRRILLPKRVVEAHDNGILHFHDMDYFAQPMFNCFHSSMRFVTRDGIRKFKECKDGEKVEVLDKDGMWREAIVSKFGKQRMFTISMHSGRCQMEVVATRDHRWILKDGSVTTELKVGDTLYGLQESGISADDYYPSTTREKNLFAFGMILGDGNDVNYNSSVNRRGTRITLCGDKKKWAPLFRELNYSEYSNKDYLIFHRTTKFSKQEFLSSRAWTYLSPEDKIALFMGYYAADGCKDRNMIHTSDERLAEMVNDISCIAGYHISSDKEITHDTNYKKGATLRCIHFCRHQSRNNLWIIDNIVPYDMHEYDAWCVTEPITHTFTLDGGIVTGNCCLSDLGDILDNGTVMNGKMIESPHTFRVACTVTTQVIAAVSSNQYGGQTIDTIHLGKYLRRSRERFEKRVNGYAIDEDAKEKLVDSLLQDELSAGIQTIQYQINTLMTTNGQAPFVTLFMYIRDDDEYIEENAMIIEEILRQRLEGIKNEAGVYVTPAFPKLVYVLDENNNLSGGKYDYMTELAAKCTAKRMYPDYISAKKMKEQYNGNVVPPMGCRSLLSPWVDSLGNYKFEGRFNCGVVSINLPQIGIVAKGDEEVFWKEFDRRLDICFEALMCRHEACRHISSDNSPIHWQHGAICRKDKHEGIEDLLFGGYSTLSLGYIGLYEVTKLMKGVSHTDPKGTEFALKVMHHLRETTDRWKKETNIGFALYGTPAESLCYRFARIDQEKFGDIEDVTDKGYYTNSYHCDVREEMNAFDKLQFESQFQPISSGGCISYVEIPNMNKNLDALKSMIKYIYNTIIYAEFNTKSDYCMECGFDGEIKLDDNNEWYCPQCGNRDISKMTVVRRTCGYLGSNDWNIGKRKEIKQRVLHVS